MRTTTQTIYISDLRKPRAKREYIKHQEKIRAGYVGLTILTMIGCIVCWAIRG